MPSSVWPVLNSLLPTYEVWLLNHDGSKMELIENYETLEYIRATNGSGVEGWGSYRLTGVASQIPHESFLLDRVVSIRRRAAGGTWEVEFEGLHRRPRFWYDKLDREMYQSSGTDLKSLLKRRTTRPLAGQAFVSSTGAFTDVMRYLARTQVGLLAAVPRRLWHLIVEADTGEGAEVSYSTRDGQLPADLEVLSGLGASFDVERVDSNYWFKVHYPREGKDLRQGQSDVPVLFSVANGNMKDPSFTDDRLMEVNVVYVAGEGTGANREIVERQSVWDAQADSPWNRIESFLEASQQTSTAALMALGDAFLTESRRQLSFGCQALPTVQCLYGRDWHVGDLVTGIYRGVSYDLSVDQVEVSLSVDEGEVIVPTLRWLSPFP